MLEGPEKAGLNRPGANASAATSARPRARIPARIQTAIPGSMEDRLNIPRGLTPRASSLPARTRQAQSRGHQTEAPPPRSRRFTPPYKNPTKNRQTPGWRNLHRKSADLHEKSVNLRRLFHICMAWIAKATDDRARRCRRKRVPQMAPTGGGRMLRGACWPFAPGRRGRMGPGMPSAIPLGIRLGRDQARVRRAKTEVGRPDGWLGQRPDSLREI